jgi:hypothetical protein
MCLELGVKISARSNNERVSNQILKLVALKLPMLMYLNLEQELTGPKGQVSVT